MYLAMLVWKHGNIDSKLSHCRSKKLLLSMLPAGLVGYVCMKKHYYSNFLYCVRTCAHLKSRAHINTLSIKNRSVLFAHTSASRYHISDLK